MKSKQIVFASQAENENGIILAFDGFKLLGSIQYTENLGLTLNTCPGGNHRFGCPEKDETDTLDRIFKDMKKKYSDLRFELYPIEE